MVAWKSFLALTVSAVSARAVAIEPGMLPGKSEKYTPPPKPKQFNHDQIVPIPTNVDLTSMQAVYQPYLAR